MHNFVVMVHFSLQRESRNQESIDTTRRRLYSDDALNEELSPALTASEARYQSQSVEEKGTTYPTEIPNEDSTAFLKRQDNVTAETRVPSKSPAEEQHPASLSFQHSLTTPMESTQISASASLPRSYQKTDTARLTSVVTARPFGSQSRGISSLPRSYTVKMLPVQLVHSEEQKVGELVQRLELGICDV